MTDEMLKELTEVRLPALCPPQPYFSDTSTTTSATTATTSTTSTTSTLPPPPPILHHRCCLPARPQVRMLRQGFKRASTAPCCLRMNLRSRAPRPATRQSELQLQEDEMSEKEESNARGTARRLVGGTTP